MSIYAGKTLRLRCPKCRGKNYTLSEHYEATYTFTVQGGVLPQESDGESFGAVTGLSAHCDCGHKWTPKRAHSLADVIAAT